MLIYFEQSFLGQIQDAFSQLLKKTERFYMFQVSKALFVCDNVEEVSMVSRTGVSMRDLL